MTSSPANSASDSVTDIHDVALELNRPLSARRTILSYGMTAIAFLFTSFALLPLLSVLLEILRLGAPLLRWETFTALPAPVGMTDLPNGFANSIQGTLLMVTIASLISIPFGIMAAIYLSEFGKNSAIASTIRFVITILSGVPSIVVGVFAYGVIVLSTKEFSGLAGGFALSIVMLPIVTLSTEEALKLVPSSQRLGSAALGANRSQTIFRIVVASALPGITTGVLLAVARAAGETAPLIFTALFSQNWIESLLDPTPSLPVLIYNYSVSPSPEQNQLAWTASLVLIGLVLLVNILSRFATRKRTNLR
jgi:phosphate transport system permease protein